MARVFLKDYKPPLYDITETHLDFHILNDENVRLRSTLFFKRCHHDAPTQLELNGEELFLEEITLNHKVIAPEKYEVSKTGLILIAPPPVFELSTTVLLNPFKNVSLEGLFVSGDILCTQNEAQGFRRMTYYLDRPDVLSKFKVAIRAQKTHYPVLLAGGNLIHEEDLSQGEHRLVYEDPIPKPCYLMAMVAGKLVKLEELYQTLSGRKVKLQLYVSSKDSKRGSFALASLRKAMRWDEKIFGLEYDLADYKIVAVDAFNFGAMENKGLNIFNAALVLADQRIATDEDYKRIEAVVAHEYFHNWSGNRVTLRDWFQLTLKEGLTVYRDQEFTADEHSRVVKRIEDTALIRSRQFREDAGPLAHPIRPLSYEKVDNFYTTTVYEKGAEVVRILATLLGRDVFHGILKGFFKNFDGQAITVEDFLGYVEKQYGLLQKKTGVGIEFSQAMWMQFRGWYHTKGTPRIRIEESYDEAKEEYSVRFEQSIPTHPMASPLLIPLRWALIDKISKKLLQEGIFPFYQNQETLVFSPIKSHPYLSLGRGFSAPVKIERQTSLEELIWAFSAESDGVSRWNVLEQILQNIFSFYCKNWDEARVPKNMQRAGLCYLWKEDLLAQFLTALQDFIRNERDLSYVSKCLMEPLANVLMNDMKRIDFNLLKSFERAWFFEMKEFLVEDFMERYEALKEIKTPAARTLKNRLLTLLVKTDKTYLSLVEKQYATSTRMSDEVTALNLLVKYGNKTIRKTINKHFYKKWKGVSLVMNKWLSAQSCIEDESVFSRLQMLMADPVYNEKEPNKVYALWGTFVHQNTYMFNHHSGKGYTQVGERIVHLDRVNPSVSARLITAFQHVKQLPDALKVQAEQVLQMIHARVRSKNAMEIIQVVMDD